jgi:uncharacterized protein (TIGR00725 family)
MKKLVVTIFGSSHPSDGDQEYQFAYELGRRLADEGFTICNGGYGGTMEATARGARECRGTVIGVVAEQFGRKANQYIDQVITVKSHIERLLKLIEMGDAYVVLPGITGTLAELAITWEYTAKGFIKQKPILLLGEFWKPIVDTLIPEFRSEGLAKMAEYPTIVRNIEECIENLKKFTNFETF